MIAGFLLASGNPLEHVAQHPHVQVADGTITVMSNQILMTIVAAALLVVLIPRAVARAYRAEDVQGLVPRGLGNFFEGICQFLRIHVARPALGEHTDRFIHYIWTVFFFILFCNLLGLVPFDAIAGLFGVRVRVGGTATGNLWVTATLAVCTLLMMIISGLRVGGRAYLAHFCPGPIWLAPLLVPVEIIGMAAKIFALAVRLFANMIAGHILLAVLLSFTAMAAAAMGTVGSVAVAIPVVLGGVVVNLLEIFVAFLQALIFSFLTAIFIGQSVTLHRDEERASPAES